MRPAVCDESLPRCVGCSDPWRAGLDDLLGSGSAVSSRGKGAAVCEDMWSQKTRVVGARRRNVEHLGRYGLRVPMKISEIIRLLEADGWTLKRISGSRRHFAHPDKPGLVTVAGKPSATLKPKKKRAF
jgi:predicted RNA binding protein YcfA (HicA-like mRNA interferase family)